MPITKTVLKFINELLSGCFCQNRMNSSSTFTYTSLNLWNTPSSVRIFPKYPDKALFVSSFLRLKVILILAQAKKYSVFLSLAICSMSLADWRWWLTKYMRLRYPSWPVPRKSVEGSTPWKPTSTQSSLGLIYRYAMRRRYDDSLFEGEDSYWEY